MQIFLNWLHRCEVKAQRQCPFEEHQYMQSQAGCALGCHDVLMESVAIYEPWAFTQQPPLTTSDFCKEAEHRDIRVTDGLLRELWRSGALAPSAESARGAPRDTSWNSCGRLASWALADPTRPPGAENTVTWTFLGREGGT